MDIIIDATFLTQDEMVQVYSKFCDFLHAKNPYSDDRNYEDILNFAQAELTRIIELLKVHLVKLLHDDEFYIVHLHSQGEDPVITHCKMNNIDYGPKWQFD